MGAAPSTPGGARASPLSPPLGPVDQHALRSMSLSPLHSPAQSLSLSRSPSRSPSGPRRLVPTTHPLLAQPRGSSRPPSRSMSRAPSCTASRPVSPTHTQPNSSHHAYAPPSLVRAAAAAPASLVAHTHRPRTHDRISPPPPMSRRGSAPAHAPPVSSSQVASPVLSPSPLAVSTLPSPTTSTVPTTSASDSHSSAVGAAAARLRALAQAHPPSRPAPTRRAPVGVYDSRAASPMASSPHSRHSHPPSSSADASGFSPVSGFSSAAPSPRTSIAPTPAQNELAAALTRHVEARDHRAQRRRSHPYTPHHHYHHPHPHPHLHHHRHLHHDEEKLSRRQSEELNHVPSYLRIPTELPLHRITGNLSPACSSPPSGETSSAVSPALSAQEPSVLDPPLSATVPELADPFSPSKGEKMADPHADIDPFTVPPSQVEPGHGTDIPEATTADPEPEREQDAPVTEPIEAQPLEERNEYPFPEVPATKGKGAPSPPVAPPLDQAAIETLPDSQAEEEHTTPLAEEGEKLEGVPWAESRAIRDRSRTPTPRGRPLPMPPLRPLDQSLRPDDWAPGVREVDRTPTAAPPRPGLEMTSSVTGTLATSERSEGLEEALMNLVPEGNKHGSNVTIRGQDQSMDKGLTPHSAHTHKHDESHPKSSGARKYHVHGSRRRTRIHPHKTKHSATSKKVDVTISYRGPRSRQRPADSVFVTGTFADDWLAGVPLMLHQVDTSQHGEKNTWSATVALHPGTHRLKFIVDGKWCTSRSMPTAVDGEGNLVNFVEVESPGTRSPVDRREPYRWRRISPFKQDSSEPSERKTGQGEQTEPIQADELQDKSPPKIKSVPTQPYDWAPVPRASEADWVWSTTIPRAIIQAEDEEARLEAEAEEAALADGYGPTEAAEQATEVVARVLAEEDKPVPPPLPRQLEKNVLNSALGPAQSGHGAVQVDDNSVLPAPNHAVLNHLAASSIKRGVLSVSTTTRYHGKYVTTILYRPAEQV